MHDLPAILQRCPLPDAHQSAPRLQCLTALTSGFPRLLRSGSSFPERLVAFAAVSSIFNAGSFAGLYWFKKVCR